MKKIFIFLFFSFLSFNLKATQNYLFETETFLNPSNEEIKITFIKHSSLILEYKNKLIYIDPVSDFANYSKMKKADFIILTHEHSDHLDKKAINNLTKKSTKLILNKNSYNILEKGNIMKNGDKISLFDNITINAVPAYNITKDRLQYHPKNRDNGYVLDFNNFKIYIAGDTENIPEMKNLKNIEIAFLPMNLPYTMTPNQVYKASKMFKPKILFPYHYGNTDTNELIKLFENNKNTTLIIKKM